MEELKKLDKQAYVEQMQQEFRKIMEQVADAVNNAPTGKVISGSEMQVRDLMAEFRQKAFETAVQMRVDSHESTFSPSEGCGGQSQTEQGPLQPQRAHEQRADQLVSPAVGGRKRGQRLSGGQTAG
jgi:acyl transferase domain-containing protein